MRTRRLFITPVELPPADLGAGVRRQMNVAMDRFLRSRGLLVGQEAFRAEMNAGWKSSKAHLARARAIKKLKATGDLVDISDPEPVEDFQ